MSVPAPVVYVLGSIVALDTALLLILLKRYGEVVRALAERPAPRSREPLQIGARVPSFAVESTDGARVTQEYFAGTGGILAFFGAQCAACHEQAPVLAAMADASAPGYCGPVLAVVAGNADAAGELLSSLGGALPVVLEEFHGPLGSAFRVSRYPTFLEVDASGRIGNVVNFVRALSTAVVTAA